MFFLDIQHELDTTLSKFVIESLIVSNNFNNPYNSNNLTLYFEKRQGKIFLQPLNYLTVTYLYISFYIYI